MKNLSTLLLLLVTVGELFGQGVAERIDTYLRILADDDQFSGSVLLARGDEIVHSAGYGQDVIAHEIPNSPQTRFRIGSITKQFTAMAVLQLVEQGRIKLEGTITDYLPDYPEAQGQRVTIHHLLNHASGIPSYTGMQEVMRQRGSMEEAPEDFIQHFCNEELEFEPGTEFRYNNSGYYLLGMIIERVSGLPYDEYLQKHIFEPLGMHNSGFEHYRSVIPRMAEGYSAVGAYPEKAGNMVMDMAGAAGALYSTTEDLLIWHRALLDKRLVTEASYEKIFTPYLNNYGYGWGIEEQDGNEIYLHSGGIDGFRSMGILIPAERLSVIVLANLESANPSLIANDLAKLLLGKPVELPAVIKEVQVPAEVLDRYVGTYELFPGFQLTITRKGERLAIKATNQPESLIYAENDRLFFSKVVNAKIEFVAGEDGMVDKLILHQNGAHEGKRVKQLN